MTRFLSGLLAGVSLATVTVAGVLQLSTPQKHYCATEDSCAVHLDYHDHEWHMEVTDTTP